MERCSHSGELIGSQSPTLGLERGKYRYLDGPCSLWRALVTGVAVVDDEQPH